MYITSIKRVRKFMISIHDISCRAGLALLLFNIIPSQDVSELYSQDTSELNSQDASESCS